MQVFISSPQRQDKDLGKAYNDFMSLLPEDSWGCLTDLDVVFLTPDAGNILTEYARRNPEAGLLTCLTNRVSPLSTMQLMNGVISDDDSMRGHIDIAERQKDNLYRTTRIDRDISGFLMLVSKKVWKEMPFDEMGKCLGVDTRYGRRLRSVGKKILRMDGLYVFHNYRLKNGIADKAHLK